MENIKIEKAGSVLKITLSRPDKRNAFNAGMISELTSAFSDIKDCRAVLLSGEGQSFCAGADLNWMKSMKDYSLEDNKKDSEKLYAMFSAIQNCPVPLIGKVQGHVMGGALGLLALCDIAAAEKDTQFSFSEVKVGLVPAVISPFVLSKVPAGKARRWMLTGDVFGARDAESLGLVNYVGDEAGINQYVDDRLKSFDKLGPEAVKDTKFLINGLSKWNEQQAFEETTRVIAARRVSEEGQEGLNGFLEKRRPKWVLQ